ncbi:MAG TPA: protein phosphatase, partial [Massilia sp.]|nr:protein phosphatase [Massilia sp.]
LRDVGHTREQLVGRLLFAALSAAPGDPDDPYSNGVTALRNALARVLASGEPQSLTTQRYPIRSILPDGGEVFVERFWSVTNTPIFGADGSLRCIQHVSIELTARRQAEEALLLSRREALDAARQAEAERAR